MLQRGEKIELLVDKTEALSQSANKFQKQSKSLKNVMWCVDVSSREKNKLNGIFLLP